MPDRGHELPDHEEAGREGATEVQRYADAIVAAAEAEPFAG